MTATQSKQASKAKEAALNHDSSGLLQRQCNSCGQHTIAGGTCSSCETKKTMPLQRKLMIGASNDPLEREADRMAEQVMSMDLPATPNIQRQAEEAVQRQESLADDELIKTKPGPWEGEEKVQRSPNGVFQAQEDLENLLNTSIGGGSPLPDEVRSFMEPRFRADFSQVRVHTDNTAVQMNHSLNARAFTHKHDVYFGQGKAPAKDELTAHELSHVIQQGHEIRRYRDKTAINFRKESKGNLIEDSFNVKMDKETKPWIEQITVKFDSLNTDGEGYKYPSGTAYVEYYKNKKKRPDFKLRVSGGSSEKRGGLGETVGGGPFLVHRIEGVGYNSGRYSVTPAPGTREERNKRYSKNLYGNMNYAVFFNGTQALHGGPRDSTSHGCVHLGWSDENPLVMQLNYHSVVGLTKVKVMYLPKP